MTVIFIGAGNVAFHLSQALQKAGHTIIQVVSRTKESASFLSGILKCPWTTNISEINLSADLYIISVTDKSIAEIAGKMNLKDQMVVHTAGSVAMDILKSHTSNFGVFYPFQTFSKKKKINFKEIPVFIEANSKSNQEILVNLASQISDNVRVLDSETRKKLHLAAVFACNFVNHCWSVAFQLLNENGLSWEIIHPLIKETVEKAMLNSPFDVQTGPAVRNDQTVMNEHLRLLEDKPDYYQIYKIISESIIRDHNQQING